MKLKIEIQMDNAAFEDREGTEAARILQEVARRIEDGLPPMGEALFLRDLNGNRVGEAKVTR